MAKTIIKSSYRRRLCCITAAYRFKVAKFDLTDSNVKKTSFRDWPYNWPEVSFHKIKFVAHPRADRLYSGAKINNIFELPKNF